MSVATSAPSPTPTPGPAQSRPGSSPRPQRPAYRVTARGVLAGEWTKFWSLRSSWVTMAVSALFLVAIGLIASGSYDPTRMGGGGPGRGPGEAMESAGTVTDAVTLALAGSTFASLAVGVLGVLLASGEYTTGMIRSTLTAVPTRLPVLWSKCLIAAGTTIVLMTSGGIVALLGGSSLLNSGVTRLGLGDAGVLRCLVGLGGYLGLVAVFGVALGALLRSSAGGIATLAGTLLILPGLVMLLPDSWTEHLTRYLPGNAGTVAMTLHPSTDSLGPWTGLGVFAGYVAVTLAAAAWRLARTDA